MVKIMYSHLASYLGPSSRLDNCECYFRLRLDFRYLYNRMSMAFGEPKTTKMW